MYKTNLNGSTWSWPQDGLISFEEETHTYTVEGVGEMTPVSTVISKFFREFDAEGVSLRKCKGDALAAARMREEWKSKGAAASQAGTFMHATIENYINSGRRVLPQNLTCTVTYDGDYVHMNKQVCIDREWSYFRAWDAVTTYAPFRTEWCVYDTDARMAGTIDLLCTLPDGTFEIYDWKRSSKIDPHEVPFCGGINGLEHICDTTYAHYCMQQNLYRYMLEKNYGIQVSRMSLVVLHPEKASYQVIPLPRLEKEVQIIVRKVRSWLV